MKKEHIKFTHMVDWIAVLPFGLKPQGQHTEDQIRDLSKKVIVEAGLDAVWNKCHPGSRQGYPSGYIFAIRQSSPLAITYLGDGRFLWTWFNESSSAIMQELSVSCVPKPSSDELWRVEGPEDQLVMFRVRTLSRLEKSGMENLLTE